MYFASSDGACDGIDFSKVAAGASVVEHGIAGRLWFHIAVPVPLGVLFDLTVLFVE